MNKYMVIAICASLIRYGWQSFGATDGDCAKVETTGDVSKFSDYKTFTESYKNTNIEGVMPARAISQALVNLKKACCMSQSMNDKKIYCVGYTKSENYPDSISLYDQLLDVGLRRLDGNSALTYGLEPDSKGKERREFITQAAQDKDGAITAKTILETRDADRTRKNIYIDTRNDAFFKDVIQHYNDQTLADRYYNMCNIASSIYQQLNGWADTTSTYKASCQSLINKRIADESTYTRLIMIKKSNELLHNTMQAYLQTYFVQNKMMPLITLLNKVKALFSTMVKTAPALKSKASN